MNSFEKPESNNESTVIDSPESKIESMFGKFLKCFKRWGEAGVFVGGILIAGNVIEHKWENDAEYNSYSATVLAGEKLNIKNNQENEIEKLFGDLAIRDIDFGDREAFFERREKIRKEPDVVGFSERGWNNFAKYSFTEKHLVYPRGWVAGEVGEVRFVDEFSKFGDGKHHIGGSVDENMFSKPTMYLYRSREKTEDNYIYVPIKEETINHEFAHANDWETDMDLNILERQELLLQIYGRMTAADSFHRDNDRYHELYIDGSKDGRYHAAREYWADICGEYFSDPKSFLLKHKGDFDLVDTFAKKNDPTFDIFNKDRGAFDSNTGKLKDVWKDK